MWKLCKARESVKTEADFPFAWVWGHFGGSSWENWESWEPQPWKRADNIGVAVAQTVQRRAWEGAGK